jgi:hypothetical protein
MQAVGNDIGRAAFGKFLAAYNCNAPGAREARLRPGRWSWSGLAGTIDFGAFYVLSVAPIRISFTLGNPHSPIWDMVTASPMLGEGERSC